MNAAPSKPRRAVCLTLRLEADTPDDLARALNTLADDVLRGELTTGVMGSPTDGAIYELLTQPDMTHDRYFEQLHAYLADERAKERARKSAEPAAALPTANQPTDPPDDLDDIHHA